MIKSRIFLSFDNDDDEDLVLTKEPADCRRLIVLGGNTAHLSTRPHAVDFGMPQLKS